VSCSLSAVWRLERQRERSLRPIKAVVSKAVVSKAVVSKAVVSKAVVSLPRTKWPGV
jgi:hypothetical protein